MEKPVTIIELTIRRKTDNPLLNKLASLNSLSNIEVMNETSSILKINRL